jgi:hypothetical protein
MAARLPPHQREPIMVWRFDEAPAEYRALSDRGDGEIWLAFIPPGYDADVPWMAKGGAFGEAAVIERLLPGGARVRIGVHG